MKIPSLISIVVPFIIVSCAGTPKNPNDREEKIRQRDVVKVTYSKNKMENPKKMGSYIIKKGDTLMWISYKLFGDYSTWKELQHLNPTKNITRLQIGDTIRYTQPETSFNWKKTGKTYNIKKGDSLGKISKKLYTTRTKWQRLWNYNNRMIKNPDLIFSGFTLFYLPEKKLAQNNTSQK